MTKALPKLAKASTNDELRAAFETHLEETHGQIGRLERVFELLDEKPRGKHCAGMAGIIEEGSEKLEEDLEDAVMDACIIKERAERRALRDRPYGTAIAWAEALELTEVAQILEETLAEEKAADAKLSALAESGINEAATAGESEDDAKTKTSRRRSAESFSREVGAGSRVGEGRTARAHGRPARRR